MSRGKWFLTIGLCLCSAGWLLAAPQQAPPAFRAGANLVLVDAYPQRDGRIIEGLTPADFEVFENGSVQKIEAFEFVRVEPNIPESTRRDPNTLAEMATLVADPHNRAFVVYLDTLHTTVFGSQAIRLPLIDALNRIVGPSDLFGVMTPAMTPAQLTFGRRTLSIEEQLSKYWAWGERQRITTDPTDPMEERLRECFHNNRPGAGDLLVADGPARRFLDDVLIERRREDRTLQSLHELIKYVGTLREGRTTIVAVTDGWVLRGEDPSLTTAAQAATDVPAPQPGRSTGTLALGLDRGLYSTCMTELTRIAYLDSARRFRDVVTEANRSNVSIYPIAAGGLGVFDNTVGERLSANPDDRSGATLLGRDARRVSDRIQALRTVAENTDGIAVVNTNDLTAGVKRIIDDISAYYLLGYTSTNSKADGTFRRIQVKMRRPELTVHARRGYLARSDSSRAMATPPPAARTVPVVDAALALLAGRQGSAEVVTYGVQIGGDLAIVAEIASAQAEAGKWAQGADVQVVVTGPNGEATGTVTGRLDVAARGAVIRVPLSPGARGPWRVNVKFTAGGDRLEDRATIETSPSGSLLGPALVYRAVPSPRAPLRPVADFQFRRTERVHVEWPTLKTLDQRQARVLGRNGQALTLGATVTEREVNGATMLAVDVNLAPLASGDYVIEVTAGSGGETETKLVAIRVAQ